jgi:tetratricopeptide (TPR) repeat protein
MKTAKIILIATIFFAIGFLAASIWAKNPKVGPATFLGKEPKEAAVALLSVAEAQAGDGSWELIGVGRLYYLSGDKSKGQTFFDKVASKGAKKNDWERIAKVYMEAEEWDKAERVLQKVVDMDQSDDSSRVLLGVLYNLKGQREKAEELFLKSLKREDLVWDTLNAAGSYMGFQPLY